MAHEKALIRPGEEKVCGDIHENDPGMLCNVPKLPEECTFIGRGSFGVVRSQLYRGFRVAVKELLPRSAVDDVQHEAEILALFCHPYLPLLFGVITTTRPYRIIMQYHGLCNRAVSTTLHEVLSNPSELCKEDVMIMLCNQLAEALDYMHCEVKVLHNDLKCNNILICDRITEASTESPNDCSVQLMVIDLGKATSIDKGKFLHINDIDKSEYVLRFPHISPEVVEGVMKQTTMSDMYSAGYIFRRIVRSGILTTDSANEVDDIAAKCLSSKFMSRPTAQEVLDFLKHVVHT